jgi:hypothetical protein
MKDQALIKKYGIKPEQQLLLLNAPDQFRERLRELPRGAQYHTTAVSQTQYDIVQIFAQNSGEVAKYFDTAVAALKPEGALWIAYPKKSAKVATDLTRDEGWQLVYAANLEGVHIFSIDETWSNIRFAPALSETEKVKAQYQGKEQLWPIYEKLAAEVQQFGIIQPSTKTRLDVGLKLPDTAVTERLQAAGHFGSRLSRRP